MRRWREKKVQRNLAETGARWLYLPNQRLWSMLRRASRFLRIETAGAEFYQDA
jgi:hypothetical protein